jgi:hypothetical protein
MPAVGLGLLDIARNLLTETRLEFQNSGHSRFSRLESLAFLRSGGANQYMSGFFDFGTVTA